MSQGSIIIFVCEHGAAKSVIAATYFNKIAKEKNLNLHAIARGTNPDRELSPNTVAGLREDGLRPAESAPRKLSTAEIESAQQIVSFCELSEEYQKNTAIEQWNDVPPVSENYEKARNRIITKLKKMMK